MHTLYTFWDNTTHYKTESVHFGGLMNSATRAPLKGSLKGSIRGSIVGFYNIGAETGTRPHLTVRH